MKMMKERYTVLIGMVLILLCIWMASGRAASATGGSAGENMVRAIEKAMKPDSRGIVHVDEGVLTQYGHESLPVLLPYARQENKGGRRVALHLITSLSRGEHPGSKKSREIVDGLVEAMIDQPSDVRHDVANALRSFRQEDFSERSRGILRELLLGGRDDAVVLAVGVAQIKEELPRILRMKEEGPRIRTAHSASIYESVSTEKLEDMLRDPKRRSSEVALELAWRSWTHDERTASGEYLNSAVELAESLKEGSEIAARYVERLRELQRTPPVRPPNVLSELSAPLMASACLGDEASISNCARIVDEAIDSNQRIMGIRRIAYVRQRPVVDLLVKYLFSDAYDGGTGDISRSYVADAAAEALEKMVTDFPARHRGERRKQYIIRCRKWVGAQKRLDLIY